MECVLKYQKECPTASNQAAVKSPKFLLFASINICFAKALLKVQG
jgi:hypothetical protein